MPSRPASLVAVVAVVITATAAAPPPAEATSALLASAAGACTRGALYAWACRADSVAAPGARFTRTFAVEKPVKTALADVWEVAVPVEEYGKGFVFAPADPAIDCDGTRCLYERTAALLVAAPTATARVRITFAVDGMWHVRQWWGPHAAAVHVAFLDEHGAVVAEGDAFRRAR